MEAETSQNTSITVTIGDQICVGCYGTVYRGTLEIDGKTVDAAFKTPNVSSSRYEQEVSMLENCKLNHMSVVKFLQASNESTQ